MDKVDPYEYYDRRINYLLQTTTITLSPKKRKYIFDLEPDKLGDITSINKYLCYTEQLLLLIEKYYGNDCLQFMRYVDY